MVNSLPYIDSHIMKQTETGPKVSKSMVKKIRKMIAQETKLLDKQGETNYLEDLNVPATPVLDSMIEGNMLETLEKSVLGKRDVTGLEELSKLDDEERFKKLVTRVQQGSNQ